MDYFAEIAAEFGPSLLQTGLAGAMLLWFATQNNYRMRSLEKSSDRQAKASLLQILSIGNLDATIRAQAKELLGEIENKEPRE